jgi:hypothetical protein
VARLIALYGGQMDETGSIKKSPDLEKIRQEMYAVSVNDEETKSTIKQAYAEHRLLLEPHGSVGWNGLMRYLMDEPADDTPEQVCVPRNRASRKISAGSEGCAFDRSKAAIEPRRARRQRRIFYHDETRLREL